MIYLVIVPIFICILTVDTLTDLGANFVGLADYSPSLPYVNLIKQSRGWGSPGAPWDGNAAYDPATGWPTNDFGVVIATSSLDMGGTYFLSAKGNATISEPVDTGTRITNQTYDPATNILTALVNVPENTTQMMLSFRNTTGPGLKDLVLLQPSYTLSSTTKMTDLILAHISRFSLLRFMDWTGTNGNSEREWTDRTPLDWAQYSPRRNPWETIPMLVNQLNTSMDVWINVPVNASDDYIRNLAQLMFNQTNPKSNIYVEYSNEVWNFGFSQAHDNTIAANISVYRDNDPYHLNYDNVSNIYTWGFRRTAYQIKHISDLFKTVFGPENVGPWKRVRPILAGQEANLYIIETGIDYISTVFGPPTNFLHGIAIAPYFDLGEYRTWSNLTTDQVLDGLNSSMQQFLPEQGWSQLSQVAVHGIYATWHQLAVYAYEAGPDTAAGCGQCSIEAKINATRHPRMTDICKTFVNGWYQFGFQRLNWYAAGAGQTSQYGSWALLEDMRQETLIDTTHMFNSTSPVAQLPRPSPKLKAMDEIHQSTVQFNFGIPIPSLNFNATNFMGHQVPYPDPDLRNLGAGATFHYPLQILQSPLLVNLTVYVAGGAGLLEAGINNEFFVQVETPQTENTTTFEAAPVMQFYLSPLVVPSFVTLRLRNIQNGYSIRSFDVVASTKGFVEEKFVLSST